jgi:hypothetical protein
MMDGWALLLRQFGIPSLNFAFLGRWLGHFPQGQWVQASIAKAAPVRGERLLGWSALLDRHHLRRTPAIDVRPEVGAIAVLASGTKARNSWRVTSDDASNNEGNVLKSSSERSRLVWRACAARLARLSNAAC